MDGESQPTQQGSPASSLLALQSLSSPFNFTPPSPTNPNDSYTYDSYWVATQPVTDPRRLGQPGSGLNNDEVADIICILHPSSRPACRAAALIHEDAPEYTLSTNSGVKIREKTSQDAAGDDELAQEGLVACDLALRLSAPLKDPVGGWHFGRNTNRCDFVLGRDQASKRISNIHFRIYINEYGIVMLEDQSTNGTAIDGVLLRGKDKENGLKYRHTLQNGSVITMTMTPPEEDYRFTVRIPQRDSEADELYERNLTAYFLRINNIRARNEALVAAGGAVRRDPVCQSFFLMTFTDSSKLNLFPTPGPSTPNPSLSSAKTVREWRGGTKYNRIGTIGKGAFAVVYKITAKFDGVPYAAKELEKRRFMKNGILDQKVDNEMKIMRKIKHVSKPSLTYLLFTNKI